jgi:hypothetical protein
MTRFVIDAPTLLHVVANGVQVSSKHQILARELHQCGIGRIDTGNGRRLGLVPPSHEVSLTALLACESGIEYKTRVRDIRAAEAKPPAGTRDNVARLWENRSVGEPQGRLRRSRLRGADRIH